MFHGLRKTTTTFLVESGRSDTTICLRTGHKSAESLKNYQNGRGREGREQQSTILATSASKHREAPQTSEEVLGKHPKRDDICVEAASLPSNHTSHEQAVPSTINHSTLPDSHVQDASTKNSDHDF